MSILAAYSASALPDKSLCGLHKRKLSASARIVTRVSAIGTQARLFARGFRRCEELLGFLEELREILKTF